MSKKDKALEDLKNQVPWPTITEVHSKSSVYRALEEYFPYAEKLVAEKRQLIEGLLKEEAELEAGLSQTRKQKAELESTHDALKERHDLRSSELEEAENRFSEIKEQEAKINQKLEDLEKRGITQELLETIDKIDFKDVEDLLKRLETEEKYQELVEELQGLRQEHQEQEARVEKAAEKAAEMEQENKQLRNEMLKVRREHSLQLDAVEVTRKALERYPKTTFLQLFEAIKRLEIRGTPQATLSYLLDRLETAGEELELETKLAKLRGNINTMLQEKARLEGVLNTIEKNVEESIKESEASSLETLGRVLRTGITSIGEMERAVLSSLEELSKKTANEIHLTRNKAEASINNLSGDAWTSLFNLFSMVKVKFEDYEKEIARYGDLREEAGKLEYYLNYAIIFFAPTINREAILSLDLDTILAIQQRVDFYIQRRLSGVKTSAPQSLANKEWGLNTWDVNLTSLSEFLTYALRQLKEMS